MHLRGHTEKLLPIFDGAEVVFVVFCYDISDSENFLIFMTFAEADEFSFLKFTFNEKVHRRNMSLLAAFLSGGEWSWRRILCSFRHF